ncbi:hypothetical protein FNF28_03689 [Cafeteria roenbergensis]|uniref:Uncharacterized protein n=1 Tax=Cafeteria roenbergensis TaxID=33653 RepID=A0A5A8DHK0_CAFRO|nr:hypothetical protein FNF28_03689 [Cafeteria roenbergensis]
MVVLNDAGTVAGAVGTVSGTLRSELLSPAATATDSVTVAEPVVSVTVSRCRCRGPGRCDDVAFTLVVRAHDGANANPAYLAVLRDATLVTSPSLYSVRSVTVDGAELFTAGGAGASWGREPLVDGVDLRCGESCRAVVGRHQHRVHAPATQPSITIASPTLSVSLETDSATSSDSEAVIGSRVTAFAAITVPEGTTSLAEVELALSDTSPGSVLRILEVVSITESSGGSSLSSSGGAFSALAAAATSGITGSGLGGVVVSLGNLTNSASSPSTAEVLTVEVRMVVLNDAGTVAGAVGTVSGTLRSELLSPAATATDSVTVAEPVTDSATSSDSEAAIGSRVTAFAAITVPEGTTSLAEVELALSDTSPGSVLRILEVVSITESSGGSSLSSSGGAFSALAAAATSGITGSGLGGVVVSLGNLTNSASSPSTAEVLTVEPVVSVTVSPVSVPGSLDAGDDVAFTLVVRAHDGANANPAYLAVLRDATLVTSPPLYSVRSVTVDGAELFTAGGAGASWAANHSSTGSIFAAASLAELSSGGTSIVYTVRLGVAVEADSIVRPEFGVVWSSHPGPADAPTAVSPPVQRSAGDPASITIASPTLSVSLETDSATSSDSEAVIGLV